MPGSPGSLRRMTINTYTILHSCDVRTIQTDDGLCVEFGRFPDVLELSLDEATVSKLLPALTDAAARFRRAGVERISGSAVS